MSDVQKPTLKHDLGAVEIAEKIAEVKTRSRDLGSVQDVLAGILEVLDLVAKTINQLESINVQKGDECGQVSKKASGN